MIACFVGSFIISYFVISVSSLTELATAETQLLRFLIEKRNIKEQIKPYAALTIQRWWKYVLKRRARSLRLTELEAYKKAKIKFSIKIKGLISDKVVSVGELAEGLDRVKSRAFSGLMSNLRGLKRQRVRQDQLHLLQQQFNVKLDKYEFMLRKYVRPSNHVVVTRSTTGRRPYRFTSITHGATDRRPVFPEAPSNLRRVSNDLVKLATRLFE
jgi:hypothetical protein